MKKINLILTAITAVTCMLLVSACQDTDIDGLIPVDTNVKSVPDRINGSEVIFSNGTTLFGKTDKYWVAEWWKYFMGLDCNHNPFNFTSFATSVTQQGPVVFLSGMPSGTAVRYVEVDKNKALLIPLMNVMKDYPAAYIDQTPRPGQTVEQYLKTEAHKYMNLATNLSAVLDNRPIKITNNNRIDSDLFFVTVNPQLQTCLEHSVSSQSLVAVTDGYWLILRNLSPGRHSLHVHAEILSTSIIPDTYYNFSVR